MKGWVIGLEIGGNEKPTMAMDLVSSAQHNARHHPSCHHRVDQRLMIFVLHFSFSD
jgi:hypothetical protein